MQKVPEPDFALGDLVREIREALEQAPPESGGWVRISDLNRATGLSRKKITTALRALLEAGKLEQGRHVLMQRLGDGATIKTFGYRLKQQEDRGLLEGVADVQETMD